MFKYVFIIPSHLNYGLFRLLVWKSIFHQNFEGVSPLSSFFFFFFATVFYLPTFIMINLVSFQYLTLCVYPVSFLLRFPLFSVF